MFSPGAWLILSGAVASSLVFLLWPAPARSGRAFWIFSPPNVKLYEAALDNWNAQHPRPAEQTHLALIHYQALERRLVAAFTSDAPVADLVETEGLLMARLFGGPVEDVGFVDLTDRIRAEGLNDAIVPAAFSQWTTRGHIFGLPHDLNPCLLAYRADIVEAAGIDVGQIETWNDFRRVLAPLIQDFDGDGRPDRFLLNFWESQRDLADALLLQAGGELFDQNDQLTLASEANARTLAALVGWLAGPERFCVDAPEFTAGGDRMRLDGTVIASVLPDWQAGTWKNYIPGLAGKVKLMPLPAWTRGGLRTTVWGGTAVGIAKAAPNVELSWKLAKHLYLSPQIAEQLFRTTCILSPVKAHWELPVYHQPDAYFSGQRIGEMFIAQAPHVPARRSSPYRQLAMERVTSALIALKAYAVAHDRFDSAFLLPEARRLLAEQQQDLAARIARNVLYRLP
ncbi:MAG TPA: extracellular solute-binding protein [Opitutaceae bacterium]|nr:extracellular solute-binding protein [Opitutaceae bacterium]